MSLLTISAFMACIATTIAQCYLKPESPEAVAGMTGKFGVLAPAMNPGSVRGSGYTSGYAVRNAKGYQSPYASGFPSGYPSVSAYPPVRHGQEMRFSKVLGGPADDGSSFKGLPSNDNGNENSNVNTNVNGMSFRRSLRFPSHDENLNSNTNVNNNMNIDYQNSRSGYGNW